MAGLRVVISEAAREDLERQSGWYFSKAGRETAESYLASFDAALTLLAEHSELGKRRKFRDPRLTGLRSAIMFGSFRVHLIFFKIEAAQLVVFRVIHGMRDLPRRLLDPPDD